MHILFDLLFQTYQSISKSLIGIFSIISGPLRHIERKNEDQKVKTVEGRNKYE